MSGLLNSIGGVSGILGTTAAPSTGTATDGYVMTATGAGVNPAWEAATGGVSHANTWYNTTAYSQDTGSAVITTWTELPATYGGGQVGASVGEASGIFTFPVIGMWQINANIEIYAGNINVVQYYTAIQTSLNNGVGYADAAYGKAGRSAGPSNVYTQTHVDFIFDVSSISGGTTRKVRIEQYSANDSVTVAGGPQVRSWVSFIKLN